MKNYVKPMVLSNEELAEGVFAGSGCYTVTQRPHQTTQNGRADYRFQFDAVHSADHSCDTQYLHITFDRPVKYVSSGGALVSGDNTPSIVIEYHYHNNSNDNIGLGDLVVNADGDPVVIAKSMTDIEN